MSVLEMARKYDVPSLHKSACIFLESLTAPPKYDCEGSYLEW